MDGQAFSSAFHELCSELLDYVVGRPISITESRSTFRPCFEYALDFDSD